MDAGIPVVHRARLQESIYRIPRLPHSRAQRSTSGGASSCQMVRAVQSAPGGIRKFHWESVIPPRRREFGLGVEKSPQRLGGKMVKDAWCPGYQGFGARSPADQDRNRPELHRQAHVPSGCAGTPSLECYTKAIPPTSELMHQDSSKIISCYHEDSDVKIAA